MPTGDPWGAAAALSAAVLLCAAAWCDWRRREVPHWIVLGLFGIWLAAAGVAPEALGAAPLAAALCAAAALAVGFAMFASGAFGGGDGKILAAVALWTGPYDLGFALLAAAALLLAFCIHSRSARATAFRARGIPVATALAPPAAVLLAARAVAAS